MIFLLILQLLFYSNPVCAGFSTFSPQCSLPTESVNVVQASNIRSTLDILWSSLFTIIACTWTILHLNVPEQRLGRHPGLWGDVKWGSKRFLKRAQWMLTSLIAPELIFGFALSQLNGALNSRRDMKKLATEDDVDWTLTHAFYANMGGFSIKCIRPEYSEFQAPDMRLDSSTASDKLSHRNRDVVLFHLTANGIFKLRQENLLRSLPQVSKEEIEDQSKSDIFVKLIVAIQIFSVIVEVVERHIRYLSISQLELAVCAFSTSAVFVYMILILKPKDVLTTRIIPNGDLNDTKSPPPVSYEYAYSLCQNVQKDTQELDYVYSRPFMRGNIHRGISNRHSPSEFSSGSNEGFYVGCWMGGMIFGIIHCLGWNFLFPTHLEQLLWRISSLFCAIMPPAMVLLGLAVSRLISVSRKVQDLLFDVQIILYVVARLFLMVEIFRSLFYLPPDAFISTWASNIPRVG